MRATTSAMHSGAPGSFGSPGARRGEHMTIEQEKELIETLKRIADSASAAGHTVQSPPWLPSCDRDGEAILAAAARGVDEGEVPHAWLRWEANAPLDHDGVDASRMQPGDARFQQSPRQSPRGGPVTDETRRGGFGGFVGWSLPRLLLARSPSRRTGGHAPSGLARPHSRPEGEFAIGVCSENHADFHRAGWAIGPSPFCRFCR